MIVEDGGLQNPKIWAVKENPGTDSPEKAMAVASSLAVGSYLQRGSAPPPPPRHLLKVESRGQTVTRRGGGVISVGGGIISPPPPGLLW